MAAILSRLQCVQTRSHMHSLRLWQGSFCACQANERRRYKVTSSLIGWAHAQNYPCSDTKGCVVLPCYWDKRKPICICYMGKHGFCHVIYAYHDLGLHGRCRFWSVNSLATEKCVSNLELVFKIISRIDIVRFPVKLPSLMIRQH